MAFTIDSPVKVARFGISSVISLIDDKLIEMMRKHYYGKAGLEYIPIACEEADYRARRITDYLNLVQTIVEAQTDRLRHEAFLKGSEIEKYFDMLPDENLLRQTWQRLGRIRNVVDRERVETYLRSQIMSGSIDVNILTKVDRDQHNADGELITDGSDGVTALRGYAQSNLRNSCLVFSSGMNTRLYQYLARCREFDPDAKGQFNKKIALKVSDYRSALIQAKMLARNGIWISDYRIESGLNCGGHAFVTAGMLLGPILEEFKTKRQELTDTLFALYTEARMKRGLPVLAAPPEISFAVQGGVGTFEEQEFLRIQYNVSRTGWGTPFLLVPEATTVDDKTLKLLCAASEKDVVLSKNSPLGVLMHYLKGSTSETEKMARIQRGKPGSPCIEKHLAINTEFSREGLCTASRKYQRLKIAQLQGLQLSRQEYNRQVQEVLSKECLCIGLCNSAAICSKQIFVKRMHAVNVMPGPNIANFSKVVSLQTMTDHIYGRTNIITTPNRQHVFIAELNLYLDYLTEQLKEDKESGHLGDKDEYYFSFFSNMRTGISHYREIPEYTIRARAEFNAALQIASFQLDFLAYQYGINEKGQ
ncbi:MAG: hypothetical protein P0Y53_17600 [Candidatus Pseudobacter hemicellulosilyticus]|uniref:Uncharacterized protein n=1 Tax=Candidatus Pseudobacter hemicellulosilyticus TaxID=3121375 RepID=A0AAJ5WQN2_9BACT|nr:MAG: hypothetical protein P0Y53_17600 [Pseudobacter sp.]